MADQVIVLVERLRKEIKTRQEQLTQVITGDVKEITTYKYVLGQLHAWNKINQYLLSASVGASKHLYTI